MRVIEYIDAVDGTMRCVREEDFLSVRELSESEHNDSMCWRTFKRIPVARLELAGDKYGADVVYSDTPYKDIVAQLKTGGNVPTARQYAQMGTTRNEDIELC